MKNLIIVLTAVALRFISPDALAQDSGGPYAYYGLGAGVAMGFAVLGAGIGQGLTARGVLESISRNPQAATKLNAPFYVGMAFIESLVLFSFAIAYLLQNH